MDIKILGIGGAINDGLPYNSFIINKKILVETPPDIMSSLFREEINISLIETIYISHFHGDHTFGFPFLILRLLWEGAKNGKTQKIDIFSPAGGYEYLTQLTKQALSGNHPCLEYIEENISFNILRDRNSISMDGLTGTALKMEHFSETLGFLLCENDIPRFAYSADTKWTENLEVMIKSEPAAILVDLNGEPDDPVKVHLSEEDLIKKGLILGNNDTVFYGTHVKSRKTSKNNRIKYVMPGQTIVL